LRPEILESDAQFAGDPIADLAGDKDTSRLGESLQSRCIIDAVALEIANADQDSRPVVATTLPFPCQPSAERTKSRSA